MTKGKGNKTFLKEFDPQKKKEFAPNGQTLVQEIWGLMGPN